MTYFWISFAIILYMAAMIGIGFYFSNKNSSTDDYYLGGRQLGPFVTAMSAEASDMSSWLLMGLPGVALAGLVGMNGSFAEAVWTAVGLAGGTYLNWLIVAKKLRLYSERIQANTIPDYFSNRFGDKSGAICFVSAIIIVIFFVPYTASGFASIGKLMNSLYGLPYHGSMVVGALVVSIYTVLGGFLAASTTDLIQSIIMTIALIVIVGYGLSTGGGLSAVMANTNDVVNYFNMSSIGGNSGLLPIFSVLAWGLGYFGMPHILLRFMAIEDKEKLKLSRRIATVWVLISMGIAIFIGIIGYTFAKNNGMIGQEGFDPERIIIYMASAISKINWLTAILAGVIISGILASIMSTSDSQMLAAASSVSENIVKRFFVKNMTPEGGMKFARGTVIAIALIAMVFAWNPDSSVFRIVSFAWAGFGASFGPAVLCSLFDRRANKYGTLAGIIAGGAMVFIWKFGIARLGGLFSIYELLPGFVVSILVNVIVSRLTPAPEKEITDEFDKVKALMKEDKALR
ncbi:MAG: sodium/proline symporter [Eubacteriales bacterium]|nr:sodium/proline symporter [Eubacteriales bacterium]